MEKEKGLISLCRDFKEKRDNIEDIKDETLFILTKLQRLKKRKEIKNLDEIEIHINKYKKKYEFLDSEWKEYNKKYLEIKKNIIELI